ncbi:MAG: PH domain-containing protein [Actinomycetota bacterium]
MTTEAVALQPLGPEALTVRRIRVLVGALTGLLASAAAAVVVVRLDVAAPVWALPVIVVGGSALAWWWAGVDHARWGWRLTADLFEVRYGVLVRRIHLVPRSRIQNVTTTSGPLQRRYGVVTLTVHTAGARTRNVSVDDLDAGHAEAIRRRLGLI